MPDEHTMNQVIIAIHGGTPIAQIARDHGVPPATIREWIRQEKAARDAKHAETDLWVADKGPGSWVGRRKPPAAKYPNTPSKQRKRKK